MSKNQLSRREAGSIMLAGAAAALGAGAGRAAAPGQPAKKNKGPTAPKPPAPPGSDPGVDMKRLLRKGRSRDWTLKAEVNVSAFVEKDGRGMPVVHDLRFASAAVVFPVLRGSASHKVYTREVVGTLKFNDVIADRLEGNSEKWAKRTNDAYPCGTRLARWELTDRDGRELTLNVDIPMTCWATVFSRADAELVKWPAAWPPLAASTFNDAQGLGAGPGGGALTLIEHTHPLIQGLVATWCDNKDPKTITPVSLAEWLAGNVLELIQPSGAGLNSNRNGLLEGFQLKGAVRTVTEKRGSEHDIACVLAAVYRAAGLPSRIVIGYDVNGEQNLNQNFLTKKADSGKSFRSWVEFCLYDEKSKVEVWVPVDPARQRTVSNRVLNNAKAWQFFGNNNESDGVMPIAFQYHPPAAGLLAHGSPAFWGWFTTPTAQVANQFLRFNAITTPRTANTDSDRKAQEELDKQEEQQQQKTP